LDETKNEYGLQLKLTKEATNQLTKMTSQNIGQQLSITFNGRLVFSPTIGGALGSDFLLSGLTKEEAESVVESLKKTNQ